MTTYLKDYTPPTFKLKQISLTFNLSPNATRVKARYELERLDAQNVLCLDGNLLDLISITLDGKLLDKGSYQCDKKTLTIKALPQNCVLEIVTEINPAKNTSLSGLYQSGDMLCTQCEAQGFRNIVYGLDRPDVLSIYTVKLVANKEEFPVLLSNGNLVEEGDLGDQHYCIWHDPHLKPSYLFALVAGKLARHSDTFTTRQGKVVDLHILTRPQDVGKTGHAMVSLQRSMRWDEQAFDREYDLDVFHLVAVSDFNMGAMENKSLNIFNNKYVLARQEIATDIDYHNIESIIGHEYFHNWSGNRVTCRDWFQLSLKEGLTVFRDQQFSADMGSAGVQRIDDVRLLRDVQFEEDAGPLAHSVRPESYEEISNFYTATVYEKGAEVVRMLHTLLGEKTFKQACNRYFEKFDGCAVTTDDFVQTMEEVSGLDLKQFRLWYSQAGTPTVKLQAYYLANKNLLKISVSQNTCNTPDQTNKQAFIIPLKLAIFGQEGQRLTFKSDGVNTNETVLQLTTSQQEFMLEGVKETPVLSVLRGFSAPVNLEFPRDEAELIFLAKHDDDAFSRWEAMVLLHLIQIDRLEAGHAKVSLNYLELLNYLLKDEKTDPALLAQLLICPSESIISQRMKIIDPDIAYRNREQLIKQVASKHEKVLSKRYRLAEKINTGVWTKNQSANRELRDVCLAILMRLEHSDAYALARSQYEKAQCMTDSMSALQSLVYSRSLDKQEALENYYKKWRKNELLVNKWFSLQSRMVMDDALKNINALILHKDFNPKNPNKVYAVIGGFLFGNPVSFHAVDGSGYTFAANWVCKLDAINPQVAARMVSCFNQWRRYNDKRQSLMQAQMVRISAHPNLSDDVSEIINKALSS